ncbi:MAG: CBS domain-containing protein [Promethearchaeota archaeon]
MPILPNLQEIKTLRKRLNISQIKMAEDLKIPQATISRIENGKGNPSYQTVKKIFDYLELEMKNKKKIKQIAKDIMTKNIIFINSGASVKETIKLMSKYNVSQLPILDENKNVGSITAKRIQKLIAESPELINAEIELIKELPFPEIEKNWEIKDISTLLTRYPALLVKEYDKYIGIITDSDLFKII